MWYWQKHRYINLRSRIECSEVNPHKDDKLIFDKRCNNNSMEKGWFLQQIIFEQLDFIGKKHKLQPKLYNIIQKLTKNGS